MLVSGVPLLASCIKWCKASPLLKKSCFICFWYFHMAKRLILEGFILSIKIIFSFYGIILSIYNVYIYLYIYIYKHKYTCAYIQKMRCLEFQNVNFVFTNLQLVIQTREVKLHKLLYMYY